jgi:hypothetical protein
LLDKPAKFSGSRGYESTIGLPVVRVPEPIRTALAPKN